MIAVMKRKFKTSGAIVLGMHDALVSLTGMIAGLTFAFADKGFIIISAIIASVTAGLSMGASCYLAEKTYENKYAINAGVATGMAYIGTCALLILPFCVMDNTYIAMISSFLIAGGIIFGCNFFIHRTNGRAFWRHALEMLTICVSVSIVAFIIGEIAQQWLTI